MKPTYKDLRAFFDTFSTGFFKLSEAGDCLYYPWGFWGSGYLVQDYWKTRNESRRLGRLTIWVLFAFAIPAGFFHAYWLFLVAAVILQFLQFRNKKKITYRLVKSKEKLGYIEVIRDQGVVMGLPLLYLTEAIWILFYCGSLFIAYITDVHWIFIALGSLFFGYVSLIFALMISLQWTSAKTKTSQ